MPASLPPAVQFPSYHSGQAGRIEGLREECGIRQRQLLGRITGHKDDAKIGVAEANSDASWLPFIPGMMMSLSSRSHPPALGIEECQRLLRTMRFQNLVPQLSNRMRVICAVAGWSSTIRIIRGHPSEA